MAPRRTPGFNDAGCFYLVSDVGKESLLHCANCLGMYNLNVNPPVGGFRPCLLFLLPLAGLFGGLSTQGDWKWRNTLKAPFSPTDPPQRP